MRDRFENQLTELNNSMVKMGSLCENAIELSVKAFTQNNNSLIPEVNVLEEQIDNLEKDIEQQCMCLLLKQQPVATDLRIISAALKMITDLERIGDQALDIAELAKYTKSENVSPAVREMAEEVLKMVVGSIESFVKHDLEMANSIISSDDVVDELFSVIKRDIIKGIKAEDANPESMIDVLMIAKYLERVSDHATNIAEWVVFSITGKHKED